MADQYLAFCFSISQVNSYEAAKAIVIKEFTAAMRKKSFLFKYEIHKSLDFCIFFLHNANFLQG